MLKIDRTGKRFERLVGTDLRGLALSERYDLQAMIRCDPAAFFAELGEPLLLLGEEIRPAPDAAQVDDRIDLLALDPSGATVVIELKRGAHKHQLLQALTYAAMIRSWDGPRLLALRAANMNTSAEAVEDELSQFRDEDAGGINQSQRIILIAEGFDYTVLATAQWLREAHEVDVRCYRLSLSVDGESQYLACTCVYPPAELTDQAFIRRQVDRSAMAADGAEGAAKLPTPGDWGTALSTVRNPALVAFFEAELAAGRKSYLPKRILRYFLGGRRRWWISARRDNAYVWQEGRFDGDVSFWRERLGVDADVEPVAKGTCLSFSLTTANQLEAFRHAVTAELTSTPFDGGTGSSPQKHPLSTLPL